MSKSIWRDEWSPFRVKLIDETARCLSNQFSISTDGQRPSWDALTREQQYNLTEYIARIFLAQDEALHNLYERGEIL